MEIIFQDINNEKVRQNSVDKNMLARDIREFMSDYKISIKDLVERSLQDIIEDIKNSNIFHFRYSDKNGDFYCDMEHDIMPDIFKQPECKVRIFDEH